jgi:hypothetical protein
VDGARVHASDRQGDLGITLQHDELDVFAGKKVVSVSALRDRQAELANLILWIQDKDQVHIFQADSAFSTTAKYCSQSYVRWDHQTEADEKAAFVTPSEKVRSCIVFARLLMQASRQSLQDAKRFDFPSLAPKPFIHREDRYAQTESSTDDVYLPSSFVDFQTLADTPEWDVMLSICLEKEHLQRATNEISDAIATGAGHHSGNNTELVRKILEEGDLVSIMQFIAACSFQINTTKSQTRSDSRIAVMGQIHTLKHQCIASLISKHVV